MTALNSEGLEKAREASVGVRRGSRWSPRSLLETFEDRYIPEPNSGCWLWIGTANATRPGGELRPVLSHGGRRDYAYRVAYELFVGSIPDGLMVCHRCNNPVCVNPHHLYAGTAKDNSADSVRAGTALYLAKPDVARASLSLGWKSQPVRRIAPDGSTVDYASIADAERDGFRNSHISGCLTGKRLTHGGYKWTRI